MPDIKTDPTLAEWIGIHDEMIALREKLILIQDDLRAVLLLVQIVADREY